MLVTSWTRSCYSEKVQDLRNSIKTSLKCYETLRRPALEDIMRDYEGVKVSKEGKIMGCQNEAVKIHETMH